ncbi:MAG: SCP2 sterol-binding domain-containing protein [Acidimicrobiales bacterium]
MAKHAFLSPEWTEAARAVHAEFGPRSELPALSVRMNLVVTEVPFGDGPVDAHLDTSAGRLDLDTGHLTDPDLTVTIDYETAKAILVEQNPQAGMQAFLAGRIKVEGDLSKLLALQAGPVDPVQAEIAERVREITE